METETRPKYLTFTASVTLDVKYIEEMMGTGEGETFSLDEIIEHGRENAWEIINELRPHHLFVFDDEGKEIRS
jgi:hypothetical protein